MHHHFAHIFFAFALCPAALTLGQPHTPDSLRPLQGFLPGTVQRQRSFEIQSLELVKEKTIEQFLFDLTKRPHHAGSPGGRAVAEYVQRRFQESGFDSKLAEYQVLLPYPLDVKVTLIEPVEKELSVKEQVEFAPDALIPFNAYSPSGDVTGEVVYANYALEEDFRTLQEMGVKVEGKIVIARYGRVYRGLKVLEATKAGAVGMILYSDPADDGYMAGDVYPKGPMRPWDAVQRGSIRFSENYAGDPLTPGRPARKNAARISMGDDPDMPKIPCTPISYGEAQHILKTLEGPVVPRTWQGGLPFTYHVGPGPARTRLQLQMDFQVRPIWNNIAELRGAKEPEKKVILGGHRDGWVFGAQDPNSGTAILLETARVLGQLKKSGWRPDRTIVIAQWDAEEFGLIGSTEWGEEFRDDLRRNAVVYMNFDATISGPNFGASGAPLLDLFLQSLTKDVLDPQRNIPVFSTWWLSQNREKARRLEEVIPEAAAVNIGRMGGGSDHVVFQNHIGVPSMGFGFGGPGGIYHSYYDNFDWMVRFGDPGFRYHATAARLAILAAMRMANADILPFTITPYADEVLRQIDALRKKLRETPDSARIDLESLRSKASSWRAAAVEADQRLATAKGRNKFGEVNALLLSIERSFVLDEGIPGRSWYKHRIVAASGYASIGLPGISATVGVKQWPAAAEEVRKLETILDEVTRKTLTISALLQ